METERSQTRAASAAPRDVAVRSFRLWKLKVDAILSDFERVGVAVRSFRLWKLKARYAANWRGKRRRSCSSFVPIVETES